MKIEVVSRFLFIAITTLVTPVDAFSSGGASLSLATARDLCSCGRSREGVLSQERWTAKHESKSSLFLLDPSMQEGTSSSNKVEPQAMMQGDETPHVKDTVRKVGKKIGISAVYGFSFFMNIVGLYFTAGLILNICGYAYEFSFEEGYKIDTIQNKRIERQFEQESRRYGRERDERLAQFSTKGAADMFGSETVSELSENTK